MKRYFRKNRPSVALFLVSNLLAAVASAIAIQPVMTLIMIAVSVLTAAFPKLTEKNASNWKSRYRSCHAVS